MRRRGFLGAGAAFVAGVSAGSSLATPVLGRRAAQDERGDGDDDGDERDEDDPLGGEASVGGLEPLGSVPVESATEAVVGDGGIAYVAAYDGFATVDIGDPADPAVLAERRDLLEGLEGLDDRSLREILDVSVDGDRLVVAGPGNPSSSDVFHGFVVYDVSDPADPVLAAEPYETGFHIHNCTLAGDHLYAVGNDRERNPLVIYDVAGDEVVEAARWSLLDRDERWAAVRPSLWYLHDVTVRDGVAALAYWDAGTVLLDVSDPSEPAFRSWMGGIDPREALESDSAENADPQLTLPGNAHYAALDDAGEVLALGREAWGSEPGDAGGVGGIDLYDVADPEEPVRVATIDAPETPDATRNAGLWTTAHNLDLREGVLYSAWYRGGVAVHDVSDPANPEELARWRDPAETAFWTARVAPDSGAFVASSAELLPNFEADGALYTFPVDDEWTAGEDGGEPAEGEPVTGADDADVTPGFTPAAGLAGGALALEWLRRRTGGSSSGGTPSR